jgi:hypothetical protein
MTDAMVYAINNLPLSLVLDETTLQSLRQCYGPAYDLHDENAHPSSVTMVMTLGAPMPTVSMAVTKQHCHYDVNKQAKKLIQ